MTQVRSAEDGMLDGRKILVTGGAGFIGSHLVERLVDLGAQVTSLDYQPPVGLQNLLSVLDQIDRIDLDLVAGDVEGLFRDSGYQLVFHLAGSAHVQSSVEDPQRDFERNALATLRLLEALRRTSPQTALIYASSAVVYRGGGSALISEDDPTAPGSPYGVSKLASERYVSVFSQLYGLRTGIARLFTVYGPRLRKQIIFDIVGRLTKDQVTLPMLGDGTQMRDFTYIADVVDALILMAQNAPLKGEAYNVASGEQVTVDALARMIGHAMGLSPTLVYSGEVYTGDTSHWFADISRLRALGYEQKVTLVEGIGRTVDWISRDLSGSRSTGAALAAGTLRDPQH